MRWSGAAVFAAVIWTLPWPFNIQKGAAGLPVNILGYTIFDKQQVVL